MERVTTENRRNKREDNAEVGQSAREAHLSQISPLLPAREGEEKSEIREKEGESKRDG